MIIDTFTWRGEKLHLVPGEKDKGCKHCTFDSRPCPFPDDKLGTELSSADIGKLSPLCCYGVTALDHSDTILMGEDDMPRYKVLYMKLRTEGKLS